MARFPDFVGGSATPQSLIAGADETVNMYVEKLTAGGKEHGAALFPTPGVSRWTPVSFVPEVGKRASIYLPAQGRFFAVFGQGFYEFDANGTPTKRNPALPLALDANPAQIVYNGIGGQLGIASGGVVYTFVLATNVFAAAPVVTAGISHLAYSSGFGLAFQTTTGKVFLSGLNDLTSWSAGTFFQRSLFADPYQAMFVDANNLVWLLGTDTFEVRYNSGTGTQPFVPLSGLVGRYGIAAPFAFAQSEMGNFWLARNPEGVGRFVVSRGAAPSVVSTYPMNTAISGILRSSRIDDAEVMVYQQEGHTFVNVGFPSAAGSTLAPTLTYDVEGDSWARRGKWNKDLGRFDLWAPRVHAFAYGKHLVGDRTSGTIYQLDTSIATESDGAGIRRLRRTPHLNREHARIPIDQFELLMDVGLGIAAGQGSDPKAMLRVSTDGGRTYSNEKQSGVGKLGEWRRRVYWTRLGAAMDWVFEVTFSEPIPFRVVDAWVNNKEGMAA